MKGLSEDCPICGKPRSAWPMAFRGDVVCSVVCTRRASVQPLASASATAVPDLPTHYVEEGEVKTVNGVFEKPDPKPLSNAAAPGDPVAPFACPGCTLPVDKEVKGVAVLHRGKVWHRFCAEVDGGHD